MLLLSYAGRIKPAVNRPTPIDSLPKIDGAMRTVMADGMGDSDVLVKIRLLSKPEKGSFLLAW